MNANIKKAVFDIEKVDGIMYAIENSCLDLEVMPESKERYNQGVAVFYALWDAIRNVSDDIERIADDEKVVDAIYAVNDVRSRK